MSFSRSISYWITEVTEHLPSLSSTQARVLAFWTFGAVLADTCGISKVVAYLAPVLGHSESALRQQLREWTWSKKHKQGVSRCDVTVADCFPHLLRWILSWWKAGEQQLVLALDATTLRDTWVILVISIVYRGCALPIAWKVLPASTPGKWKPYWIELCQSLRGCIPENWLVIVTADRGLYADWLFATIQSLGWHPYLRINRQGMFREQSHESWKHLSSLVPNRSDTYAHTVHCFKEHTVQATLLARNEPGYAEPWLIVTDLPAHTAAIVWYSMRMWIEAGFKDIKRGGWQWHHTKMQWAERVERLWLVIAVAMLWSVSVGTCMDPDIPPSSLPSLPSVRRWLTARRKALPTHDSDHPRILSIVSRGLCLLRTWFLTHRSLLVGLFVTGQWTDSFPVLSRPTPKKKQFSG